MKQEYLKGFAEKCAELGVDPRELTKEAGKLDAFTNLLDSMKDAYQGSSLQGGIESIGEGAGELWDKITGSAVGQATGEAGKAVGDAAVSAGEYTGDKVKDLVEVLRGLLQGGEKKASAEPTPYELGVMEKCAELGVDYDMVKEALWGRISKALGSAGGFLKRLPGMLSDVGRRAVSGADDLARRAGMGVDDLARRAAYGADDLTRRAVSGVGGKARGAMDAARLYGSAGLGHAKNFYKGMATPWKWNQMGRAGKAGAITTGLGGVGMAGAAAEGLMSGPQPGQLTRRGLEY